nr:MAG TPA: hypothetical protein [Caudoviricetes sp.]
MFLTLQKLQMYYLFSKYHLINLQILYFLK